VDVVCKEPLRGLVGTSPRIPGRLAGVLAKTLNGIEEHGTHELNLAPDRARPAGAVVELLGQDGGGREELYDGREIIRE